MERTLRGRGCGIRNSKKWYIICEIMGFVRIFWKEQYPRGLLAKNLHSGAKLNCLWDIQAQLCSDDSIQILLNLTWSKRLYPSQIWGYWRWVTSQTKQTVKRSVPYFFFTSGFKNSITVSCTDYSCTAVRRWLLYMPTLPDYTLVSRIRHRSPALPYGSPYLPNKIIFCAFLCLGLKVSPFLAQNVIFLFVVQFLEHFSRI